MRFAGKFLNNLRGGVLEWFVAYRFADNWKGATSLSPIRIKNPIGRYYADPFLISRGEKKYCFVEDYSWKERRAKISVLELSSAGCKVLGVALEEPFHLSFPFLISRGDALYMCPETSANRDIRIYKCTDFPLRWELHRVIMRSISAVDTCIFEFGGRWWMLTSFDSSDIGDHGSELHAYFADSFDSEAWTPHASNPIVFDPMRGRNGGMIVEPSSVYRVFQTHGFDMYGESMGVSKILKLTPDLYQEEIISVFKPDCFEGISGTHTLAYNDGVLALDFVRRSEVPLGDFCGRSSLQ
jgi:hypothetical protein